MNQWTEMRSNEQGLVWRQHPGCSRWIKWRRWWPTSGAHNQSITSNMVDVVTYLNTITLVWKYGPIYEETKNKCHILQSCIWDFIVHQFGTPAANKSTFRCHWDCPNLLSRIYFRAIPGTRIWIMSSLFLSPWTLWTAVMKQTVLQRQKQNHQLNKILNCYQH